MCFQCNKKNKKKVESLAFLMSITLSRPNEQSGEWRTSSRIDISTSSQSSCPFSNFERRVQWINWWLRGTWRSASERKRNVEGDLRLDQLTVESESVAEKGESVRFWNRIKEVRPKSSRYHHRNHQHTAYPKGIISLPAPSLCYTFSKCRINPITEKNCTTCKRPLFKSARRYKSVSTRTTYEIRICLNWRSAWGLSFYNDINHQTCQPTELLTIWWYTMVE